MTAPSRGPPLGDSRLSRVRLPTAFAAAGSDWPGFASPGYAASPGFRTLLTPCSSRNLSVVFQTETLLGLCPSKGSPSAAWSAPLGRSCPPGVGSNGSAAGSGRASPTSRALVSAEVRCRSAAEAAGPARASLGLSPLQGCISLRDSPARHGASSPGLERGRRRTACVAPPFGVSIAVGLDVLLGDRRPS
jgi:hypothetical protein